MYENLKTPCFILNEQDLVDNIKGFKEALASKFKQNIIGYSVKTNSLPYVLSLAKEYGCYAEVVSYHEYALALKLGFDKRHIVYNGPMKSKETFLQAIQDGALVNIECWREIEWLKELPQDKEFEIGVRLNINISKISPEDENNPEDDSRFGFAYESGEFKKALDLIAEIKNMKVVGMHSHRESRTRNVSFYSKVMKYMQDIILEYGMQLKYWDLGGGFFGNMPNKPTYQEYVDAFYDALMPELRDLCIIVEPGNAIVASAFDYMMEVLDVKRHDDQIYVCTDGTRNDVDPFFKKSDYFKEFIYKNAEGKNAQMSQAVNGLTCLEYDRLFALPEDSRQLVEGDRIVFHRVGAYTMALTPLFIHYLPNVYLLKDGELSLIREEWSENNYIENSKF